jgi:hypothetical protein
MKRKIKTVKKRKRTYPPNKEVRSLRVLETTQRYVLEARMNLSHAASNLSLFNEGKNLTTRIKRIKKSIEALDAEVGVEIENTTKGIKW